MAGKVSDQKHNLNMWMPLSLVSKLRKNATAQGLSLSAYVRMVLINAIGK